MKIMSALFDTMLIPLAMVEDVFTLLPRRSMMDYDQSATRRQIEKVESDLGL